MYHRLLLGAMMKTAGVFTVIFKSFMATEEMPDDWRTENMIPLFKKSRRDRPVNDMTKSRICGKE